MSQALYRKNRPKKLRDVVGQEHITSTLENALKKGTISHAYLFTGPRGVGKTSVARILAHDVNGLPYDDDTMHMDIIEIDAASNRRIDEIRDLRDRVSVAPTSAKYKVYIIDEVHMLTREAFNALLKTLEEPPAHVVFILATTESHKLPETIVSRTQRFTFRPIPLLAITKQLRSIADNEKIAISDDALELIAKHGDGSFRDSISLLDQAAGHNGKIDVNYIQTMLGIPPQESIKNLANNLAAGDKSQIVQHLNQLAAQGFSAAHIAKQLGLMWRNKILENQEFTQADFELSQKLLNVSSAHDPSSYLEIILLEYAVSIPAKPMPSASVSKVPKLRKDEQTTRKKAQALVERPPVKTSKIKVQNSNEEHVVGDIGAGTDMIDAEAWNKILAELKKHHNTLYGVVRMAKPKFKEGIVELGFAFAFHRKRLSEKKNQQLIAGIIHDVTGKRVNVECVEADQKPYTSSTQSAVIPPAERSKTDTITAPDLASISNIFGGGEVLEQ